MATLKRSAETLYDPTASVKLNEGGAVMAVTGFLNFKNVVKLRNQGTYLLNQQTPAEIIVDLEGIENSDNSGLVLLLAWKRDAGRLQKKLIFRRVPDFLQRMAQVFGLNSIIENN